MKIVMFLEHELRVKFVIRNAFPYFTPNSYFKNTGVRVYIYIVNNFIHQVK